MNRYDVIVLGVGGAGSAALFQLARRGVRVLGLDRFPPGHNRGSSHGQTRIIRKAYFEHPDYVPLLERAYALWVELESWCSEQLYFPVGLLEVGPPGGIVVPGVLESARRHALRVETLEPAEVLARFPGFCLPEGASAVFEPEAGYLLVERCVVAHARAAERLGAEIRSDEEIVGWRAQHGGVEVRTARGTYAADRLVITAGAWAGKLIAELGVPLRVLRKHLHWFGNGDPQYRSDRGCPGFFFEIPAGCYYGFPQIDERGVKVAEHSGGTEVEDALEDDRSVEPEERRRVEEFLRAHLPGVSGPATDHSACHYTMSPDEHFLVDRHPEYEQVCFAAGLSGHGFKFTSALGEVLADLALDGATRRPIRFLRRARFG